MRPFPRLEPAAGTQIHGLAFLAAAYAAGRHDGWCGLRNNRRGTHDSALIIRKILYFKKYGDGGLIGIEVKRTRRIGSADLKGLKAFRDEYPMARCLVFANVTRPQHCDGIEIFPLQAALSTLPDILTSSGK